MSEKAAPVASLGLPLGGDFWSAVDQLKRIADLSADAALTEGRVEPDHHLLELCATALHHLHHANKSYAARPAWRFANEADKQALIAQDAQRLKEWNEGNGLARAPMIAIAKIKATSAAGIYAKAMIVRASKTGAAGLAMSLARDLLDCPGLRVAIWPASEV